MVDLNIEKIKSSLNTNKYGKEIIYFDEINSTNTYAKTNIASLEHGSVIIAEKQSSGRGRQGNRWHSERGQGLWMSIVIKNKLGLSDILKVTSVVALAIKEGLEKIIDINVYIKWPNDIIVNNKKVCGILVESIIKGQNIEAIIIGVGINIKQDSSYFNELKHASSLDIESRDHISREDVFISVLETLEYRLQKFFIDRKLDIQELKKASILLNKRVRIIEKDREFIGYVTGFLEDGSIEILYNNDMYYYKTSDISIRGVDSYID